MLLLLVPGVGMGASMEPFIPPPPVEEVVISPSGGVPAADYRDRYYDHTRTSEQVAEARRRFGIEEKAAVIVSDVAARQAERLESDGQKRFEELLRELQLEGIEFDARYLQALNYERQLLIDLEIQRRMQLVLRQKEEEELLLLMMIAAASTT